MELMQIIGQVGFPIAVAGWLLIKLDGTMEKAATAARELTVKLDAHTERCERCRAWRELEPCDSCGRKEVKP